jgi:hypothetical protein
VDRGRHLAALEEVELVSVGALTCDLGACFDVDRFKRAREARETHAIEIAKVRNEAEESLERVIVIVGHGARRLAPGAIPSLCAGADGSNEPALLAKQRRTPLFV